MSAAEEILTRTGNLSMQIVDRKFMRSIPFTYKGKQQDVDDRYITDKGITMKLKLYLRKLMIIPVKLKR